MKDYVTFNYIKENKLFTGYYLNNRKLKELADMGVVKTISIDKVINYCVDDIKVYTEEIDNFLKEHISLKELANIEFGIKPYAKQIRDIEAFFRKLNICITGHKYIPFNQPQKYIDKKDYELFRRKYIKFNELFYQQNFYTVAGEFYSELTKKNIKTVNVYNKFNYIYIDIEEYKNSDYSVFKSSNQDISYDEARKRLELSDSKKNFSIILSEYNISSYRGKYKKNYISNKDMDYLIIEQKKILRDFRENYYSLDDLKKIFVKELDSKVPEKVSTFNKIKIPVIARTLEYRNKTVLYSKNEVDRHKELLLRENKISNLLKITSNNYNCLLYDFLDIYDFNFEKNTTVTMNYWHKYLLRQIDQSSALHETLINKISKYAKITLLLHDITLPNTELFDLTENELNLRVFNDNIHRSYRDVILRFINELNEILVEKRINIIKTDKLRLSSSNKSKQKEIYDLDEYIRLCYFIADNNYHKERALQVIKELYMKKSSTYIDYISYWLYVLIHLNNGFRKSTIIDFPKSNENVLAYLGVTTIDELENVQINKKQAQYIVKMYQVNWYKHNKNNEESPFYCSEMLAISFSYCILYIEFIANMKGYSTEKLIKFSTILPNKVINRYFFLDFSKKANFIFESRKMNSTVLTLINTVLNKHKNLDLINIARHLRGHVNIETTKIYINIPQKHFDMVVDQLFEIGSFGYVYTELYIKKINEEVDEDKKMEFITNFKELFGEVSQIELLLNKITYIHQSRREAKNYIDLLNKEDIKVKLLQLSLGLGYVKEVNYQCLFNQCLNINYDCDKCPFAIPNWYELITIINRLNRNILNYKSALMNREYQLGSMKKLYNLILWDVEKIIQGIKVFGKDVIELLLEQSFEEYIKELVKLPDPIKSIEGV